MSSNRPNVSLTLLAGLGIGAAVMYLLDPDRGTRRRHIAADRARRAARLGGRETREAVENAKNHVIGKATEARNRMTEETVDDGQLVERVRAELGHHVEHARAIEVVAENGTVTLTGAVAPDEVGKAASTVAGVRGVQRVQNQLVARPTEVRPTQ